MGGARFDASPDSMLAGRYQMVSLHFEDEHVRCLHCLDIRNGSTVAVRAFHRGGYAFNRGMSEVRAMPLPPYFNTPEADSNSRSAPHHFFAPSFCVFIASLPDCLTPLRMLQVRSLQMLQQLAAHDPDTYRVLQMSDYFVYEGHLFVVHDLYDATLLDLAHSAFGYFTQSRLQRVAQQLLELLHLMHSFELTHGRLAPENVCVVEYDRCDVLVKGFDFGSDRRLQSRDVFRAPEVLLGCETTSKSDLW